MDGIIKIVKNLHSGKPLKGEIKMENKITGQTLIAEAINLNPNAGEILLARGMHCLGCAIAHGETLEEAAVVHNIDLQELLTALNEGL